MELNNKTESDTQRPSFGLHEQAESNLDCQSPVTLVFSPQLSYHEPDDEPAEKSFETIEEYDKPTPTSQSLAIHEPDLLEFLTADRKIRDETCRFVCSRWFPAKLVLCWPEDPIPQLAVSSLETDWARSGNFLFKEQLYAQAMFCFDKAGLLLERDIATAYQFRKEAWLLFAKSADQETWRNSFTKAANSFLRCAPRTNGKQRTACFIRAAECFSQTADWKLAAGAFLSAEEFGLAAKNLCHAGCFVDAADIVKKHKDRIQKELADEVINTARLGCLRRSEYEKAAKLLDSAEEQLVNMKSHGFNTAHLPLADRKCHDNASGVALGDGDILENIQLLSTSSDDLMRQALTQILRGLWITLPYGSATFELNNPVVTSLLEQVSRFDLRVLNEDEHRQLNMFQSIHARNTDRIISLAKVNSVLSRSSEALLCFAHCSHDLYALQNATMSKFLSNSALALSYYNGLSALARTFQASSVDTQRLLGFEPIHFDDSTSSVGGESLAAPTFRLFSSSLMFKNVKDITGDAEPAPYVLGLTSLTLSKSDITQLAIKTIIDKLGSEVRNTHDVAKTLRYIQPCLNFAIFGKCGLSVCGRHELGSYQLVGDVRQTHFNERLRAHLLPILIVHLCQAEATSEDSQHLRW
ncbi:hypothetical protein FRC07_011289 [Ceratobasidium sp. 392]|nr:hypothetical protein FRC07_011289 [Ceratobasidium sp. 392]